MIAVGKLGGAEALAAALAAGVDVVALGRQLIADPNAAGKLLAGDDAAVEENFLFLVEKPDKAIEVLSRSEFLKRTGQQQ